MPENKTEGVNFISSPHYRQSSTMHQQQAMQKIALVDMVTELELLKNNCGCLPRKAGAHAHKEATGSSQLIIYPQSWQVFKSILAEYQMNELGWCPLSAATPERTGTIRVFERAHCSSPWLPSGPASRPSGKTTTTHVREWVQTA